MIRIDLYSLNENKNENNICNSDTLLDSRVLLLNEFYYLFIFINDMFFELKNYISKLNNNNKDLFTIKQSNNHSINLNYEFNNIIKDDNDDDNNLCCICLDHFQN